MSNKAALWRSKKNQKLSDILLSIESINEMQSFLSDVMTEKEIIEISSRLEAARMLNEGCKYTDIVSKTKLSSRTVARISDCIQNGCGGYDIVLNQTTSHHNNGVFNY